VLRAMGLGDVVDSPAPLAAALLQSGACFTHNGGLTREVLGGQLVVQSSLLQTRFLVCQSMVSAMMSMPCGVRSKTSIHYISSDCD
jgi:hypothetical protein